MFSVPGHSTRGTGDVAVSLSRKRRPPNPREQARRKAWGAKYGPAVREAVRAVIQEGKRK